MGIQRLDITVGHTEPFELNVEVPGGRVRLLRFHLDEQGVEVAEGGDDETTAGDDDDGATVKVADGPGRKPPCTGPEGTEGVLVMAPTEGVFKVRDGFGKLLATTPDVTTGVRIQVVREDKGG